MREVEASCNFEFMEMVLPEVGEAFRNTHHWLELDVSIYLAWDELDAGNLMNVFEQWKMVCMS